jgi:hypothetical protein
MQLVGQLLEKLLVWLVKSSPALTIDPRARS